MDYSITAKQLLQAVGGDKNVAAVSHCMTRLRFNLKNSSGVDLKAIEKIEGVMGAVSKGGQVQIIIGNNVAKAYEELMKLGSFKEGGVSGGRNPLVIALDFIAGCMTPLIPAILGGSLIKVLLVILGPTLTGVLATESQTYVILDALGDAAFYFLPMLLAWAAARKLNTSVPLAMLLAGFLIHPNIISLLGADEAVKFLGIPVYPGSYTSSVIPVLLTVILMKYVEMLADKITPEWSKSFLKPLLVVIITAPVSLLLLAPAGQMLGDGLAFVMDAVYNFFPPLAMGLFGAFMPFIVMVGMHYAFMPNALANMGNPAVGFDIMLLPAMFCSNLAQAAATLAVAIKSKKSKIRQVSGTSSVSAFLAGVTEPAMYGVTLKYKTPMVAACIGGGVAGVLMGIFRTKVYAFAVPSLLSLPGLIPTNDSATFSNFVTGCICVGVAIVITFVLTLILYKDPVEDEDEGGAPVKASPPAGKTLGVESPLEGEIVAMEAIDDPTFSTGVLGRGYGVVPSRGLVVAPFDGRVENIFETGHAVGLASDDGVELLVHVGLETVALKGKYFTPLVKNGDRVKKGQKLIEFDIDGIKAAGYDITTPVVVTNADRFADVQLPAGGATEALQPQIVLRA